MAFIYNAVPHFVRLILFDNYHLMRDMHVGYCYLAAYSPIPNSFEMQMNQIEMKCAHLETCSLAEYIPYSIAEWIQLTIERKKIIVRSSFRVDTSNDRKIRITVSICQVQFPRSATNKPSKNVPNNFRSFINRFSSRKLKNANSYIKTPKFHVEISMVFRCLQHHFDWFSI